jgi:hypothetical protein
VHILQVYISNVSGDMLQLFHANVAKEDRDVAIVVHVCCKLLFPMFHLFFQTYVASVLSGYYIHFTHTLQVSYLDVVYVLQCFSSVFQVPFASVLEVYFKCFIRL